MVIIWQSAWIVVVCYLYIYLDFSYIYYSCLLPWLRLNKDYQNVHCVGIAAKIFKVIGQRSRSWPVSMLWRRRHAFWQRWVETHCFKRVCCICDRLILTTYLIFVFLSGRNVKSQIHRQQWSKIMEAAVQLSCLSVK